MDTLIEAVNHALSADMLSLGLSASIFGVLSHIVLFSRITVEYHIYTLLRLYTSTVFAIGLAYLFITDFTPRDIISRIALINSAFGLGLASSIAIYRAYFHRLHRFPGPWLSKVSRFYDTYLAGKNVQYQNELAILHEKYGDFIRTGPREICIIRKSAIPLLFSAQTKCRKSTLYAQAQIEAKNCSVHHTRDVEDHRRRRKAWDRGFSLKAIASYEPKVISQVDLLLSQIDKNPGQQFDVTRWSMFLSFDIMGLVGFGKDFNNLKSGVEHPGIKAVRDHMTFIGVLSHVPWVLNLATNIPGATYLVAEFYKWCEDEVLEKNNNLDLTKNPQDVVSWLLKAYIEKDISAPPSANALHEDARAILIAGSETTATVLASVLYYLAKYPGVLAKLQRQLDNAMPGGSSEWTYEKIKQVTYLDDVINETLRLRPAIMTLGSRVTPPEGLQIDEVYIPGDVIVSVPQKLLQTDERYYVDAKEFVPERWGEKKEMSHEGAPFYPFLTGPYSCPGKSLAYLSLRTSVSKLAQRYDIKFAQGETGWTFENKTLDTFTTGLPPLNIEFVRR